MLDQVFILSDNLTVHALDVLAFCWFCCAWFGYGGVTSRSHQKPGNLLSTMHQYRLNWMHEMLKRENRMPDMAGVGNLMRSISFFANTSIFLVIGSLGIIGYRDQVQEMIQAIPFALPPSLFLFEVKVILLVLIFMHAFFKYTWSLRQWNYITIYVGAAPQCREHLELHHQYAARGAWLMTNAARHFNLGLRAYYYGFATISWFIHPIAFILTTTVIILVLYRREFHSSMYFALSQDSPLYREAPHVTR